MMKRTFPFVGTVTVSLLLSALSYADNRPAPLFQGGMTSAAQEILKNVSAPAFPEQCVSYLSALQAQLKSLKPSEAPQDEITEHSAELIQALWSIRLELHKRLPELSPSCVVEIRNTSRLLRFIEDFLGERAGRQAGTVRDLDPAALDFNAQIVPVLNRAPYYLTQFNPEVSDFEFKNGDIMIARGPSFMSALISRMGDVSSQFSHVILVHVDAQTNKVETIESYVGLGVDLYDIDTALKNENIRLLLLRPKDQELASKAADFMYATVKQSIASGKKIHYDYSLDFKDHSAVSCAEVGGWAFEAASSGQMTLPYYPTMISTNPEFLHHMGLVQGLTFAPGDMEVDPRFEMIMEWRDLRLTRDSRVKDSILTSVLNWADHDGYRLRNTPSSLLASDVIWPLRRTSAWPMLHKFLHIQDFSLEIPRNMFETLYMLNGIATDMQSEIRSQDAAFEKATGWAMTYQDIYSALEKFRLDDLDTYVNISTRGQSKIHQTFRPDRLPWPEHVIGPQ